MPVHTTVKDIQFQLNISQEDAVFAKGEIHFVQKVTEDTVTLLAKQAGAVPLIFTHGELAELLESEYFAIEYGYFSDRQAARRARGKSFTVTPVSQNPAFGVPRRGLVRSNAQRRRRRMVQQIIKQVD